MNSTYYKILNEIASVFDMDQWDEQINLFTNVIDKQLNTFVHYTKYEDIYILENCNTHDFPLYNFYKERCYVNGEKVVLDKYGTTENKWKDRETVDVIIEDLNQLGGSCKFMFANCESLVSIPASFDTSGVTDMESMFYNCKYLESIPLFDTSNVADMESMFGWCNSLVSVPKFNTSGVNKMAYMFEGCKSLVSVPLFNTSRVTDMERMFQGCYSLSEETKQAWSSVYNFETNEKK